MKDDALLREYVMLLSERIKSNNTRQSTRLGTKFDMKKFESLETIKQMKEYCDEFLPYANQGSARTVYYLSGRYVLKIARSERGIAQNQAEVDVITNPASSAVFAAIKRFDPQNRWLMSEVVRPLHDGNEFKQLTGIPWSDFRLHMRMIFTPEEFTEDDYEIAKEKPPEFVTIVANAMIANKLLLGDINVLEHWGKTPSGRAVILDYGFTEDVLTSYYK